MPPVANGKPLRVSRTTDTLTLERTQFVHLNTDVSVWGESKSLCSSRYEPNTRVNRDPNSGIPIWMLPPLVVMRPRSAIVKRCLVLCNRRLPEIRLPLIAGSVYVTLKSLRLLPNCTWNWI